MNGVVSRLTSLDANRASTFSLPKSRTHKLTKILLKTERQHQMNEQVVVVQVIPPPKKKFKQFSVFSLVKSSFISGLEFSGRQREIPAGNV